jgi:hypothetical protein
LAYIALVLFDKEITMKFHQVLLGILFTFLSIECQAAGKVPVITDILQENHGAKLSIVNFRGFEERVKKGKKTFDLNNSKQFPEAKKDLFLRSLYNGDSKEKTCVIYSVLLEAAAITSAKSQSRTVNVLNAIQADTDVNRELASRPNAIIILSRKQDTLDTILTLSETDKTEIATQLGIIFGAPDATPSVLSADSSNVTLRGGSRGKKPKSPPPLSSIAPIKTAEEIEQDNIRAQWSVFRVSGYADLLREEGENVLGFTSGMKASEFIKKPSTLAKAEERISAATEYYQQELLRNINEVRSLRTQIETASMAVEDVNTMLRDLGLDRIIKRLPSASVGKEHAKNALLKLKEQKDEADALLCDNTKAILELRAQIEVAKLSKK